MIRKKISLFIAVLGFAFFANAQPSAIENNAPRRDTSYVNFLIKEATSIISNNQDSAIILATKARSLQKS